MLILLITYAKVDTARVMVCFGGVLKVIFIFIIFCFYIRVFLSIYQGLYFHDFILSSCRLHFCMYWWFFHGFFHVFPCSSFQTVI